MLTSSEIRNAGDQSNRGLEIKLNEFFNINLLQRAPERLLREKFAIFSGVRLAGWCVWSV